MIECFLVIIQLLDYIFHNQDRRKICHLQGRLNPKWLHCFCFLHYIVQRRMVPQLVNVKYYFTDAVTDRVVLWDWKHDQNMNNPDWLQSHATLFDEKKNPFPLLSAYLLLLLLLLFCFWLLLPDYTQTLTQANLLHPQNGLPSPTLPTFYSFVNCTAQLKKKKPMLLKNHHPGAGQLHSLSSYTSGLDFQPTLMFYLPTPHNGLF